MKPSPVSYVIVNSAVLLNHNPGHPHLEQWREVGRKYKQRWHGRDEDEGESRDYPKPIPTGCRVQVVRSVADWSHGVLTERSIQNACKFVYELSKIENSNHYG